MRQRMNKEFSVEKSTEIVRVCSVVLGSCVLLKMQSAVTVTVAKNRRPHIADEYHPIVMLDLVQCSNYTTLSPFVSCNHRAEQSGGRAGSGGRRGGGEQG